MDRLDTPANERFVRLVHHALRHLYDPTELNSSPLVALLGVKPREDAPSGLRRLLLAAIEGLKPDAGVPQDARARKLYDVLTRRYAEQFTLQEVAAKLAVSVRQLGRLETLAVQLLANRLWSQHDVAARLQGENGDAPAGAPAAGTPSFDQELEYLRKSSATQLMDPLEMAQAAWRVVEPLARLLKVEVHFDAPPLLPRVLVQETTVHQALVNVLTTALRCVAGGALHVVLQPAGRQIAVDVHALAGDAGASLALTGKHLDMARQLLAPSDASIELLPGAGPAAPFQVRITLRTAQEATVLVIDDNVDTLRLLERYLANTRYRFLGTANPQQAVTLAANANPQIIVLDVMLPGIDGWELLGRLHEHPRTRAIPVIVCTVLAEEDLALALGAAALIHKPITQPAFLAALDRQLDHLGRESG